MMDATFGLSLQSSAKYIFARQIDLLCFEAAKSIQIMAIRKRKDMNGKLCNDVLKMNLVNRRQ